jgi:predicted hydrocarbon binding protein
MRPEGSHTRRSVPLCQPASRFISPFLSGVLTKGAGERLAVGETKCNDSGIEKLD